MITLDYIKSLVSRELECDIGEGDITSLSVLPPGCEASGKIIAKRDGIICGLGFAQVAFQLVDDSTNFKPLRSDGDKVFEGDTIAEISGDAVSVLSAERTALNFLGHLSGIATNTGEIVEKIANYRTKILDTRKTTPGLRFAEKYAVKCGGGQNHRFGLYDMILVKDNHIAAAGGIENTLRKLYDSQKPNVPVEIEVTNFEQLEIALGYPLDRIMLDNFHPDDVMRAIDIRNKSGAEIPFECSGNITSENVVEYAETGVEFISIGAITHSAKQLDLSLDIEIKKY